MKNILITSIGGDVAQSVALTIKKNFPNYNIFGTDINRLSEKKPYLNNFIKINNAKSKNYIPNLISIIEKSEIDILIPVNENEIISICRSLNKLNTKIVMPGIKPVEYFTDKYLTYKKLKSYNFPLPWTVLSKNDLPKNYPCILKPRYGSGSKQIKIIKNETEAKINQKINTNFIFQELLTPSDKEITCAVYRSLNNEVYSISFLRKLTNGFTSWAKVIKNSQIDKLCYDISNLFELRGSFNIQLILTANGPKIFEINPRFSSTVYMRDLIGFNDVKWTLDEINGKKIYFNKIQNNTVLIKKSLDDIKIINETDKN